MPDPIFADPRLAAIYDDIDGDRDDLDLYESIVDEFAAHTVLDLGCGTGVLACRLVARGVTMIGADPAEASLQVARAKPGAELVTWLHGDATTLPAMAVDMMTMTANVAQVFLTDDEWAATLDGCRRALRDGGVLVFESRIPSDRAWERWTRELTVETTDTVAGPVQHWVDVTDVRLPLVSFRQHYRFMRTGDLLTSDSTLRFRDGPEIEASLVAGGFEVVDVRDAPDRPGREFVYIARRA